MAERKVKITLPNIGTVEGTVVQVLESTDRWCEIKLEDDTTLRLKPVVIYISVTRIDGHYDPQGNPMYAVQAGQAITADAPDHLRQAAQVPKVQ